MIIIKNDFRIFITSLSHEQVEEYFASGQDCSWAAGNDYSTQKTHWDVTPSIMREMAAWCEQHHHTWQQVKGDPL